MIILIIQRRELGSYKKGFNFFTVFRVSEIPSYNFESILKIVKFSLGCNFENFRQ